MVSSAVVQTRFRAVRPNFKTAEVVVMNKSAIALAADSTVTIEFARLNSLERKMYNTINKPFNVSKVDPITVMFYGVANLWGMSWETIDKEYRRQLGEQPFRTLENFADELTRFTKNQEFLSNETT